MEHGTWSKDQHCRSEWPPPPLLLTPGLSSAMVHGPWPPPGVRSPKSNLTIDPSTAQKLERRKGGPKARIDQEPLASERGGGFEIRSTRAR